MDTKIDIKNFSSYSKEVCLQNFLLINQVLRDLETKGDLSGIEKIENEVIPVYENLFLSLDEENLKNIHEENFEIFENIKKTIENLAKDAKLSTEYINSQIKRREELRGKSGSEVVERLFKYKLKELKKIKGDIFSKLNKLLNEEEKLNLDLSNAIQEVEQLEILNKINPIRRRYRELAELLEKYQAELAETENKISKKWYYEIYGTIEEKSLLDVYNMK